MTDEERVAAAVAAKLAGERFYVGQRVTNAIRPGETFVIHSISGVDNSIVGRLITIVRPDGHAMNEHAIWLDPIPEG
jgi:hypothetical protein